MTGRDLAAIGLLLVGSFQMLGHACRSKGLRGLGLASGVAPYPKVFCEADGYEAFAATFHLEGELPDGTLWSRTMTPEWYAQLEGPYNRRNVYGAALAFAPRLPEKLREQVIHHALAENSALRTELGVPESLANARVRIVPREGEREGPWTYRAEDTP